MIRESLCFDEHIRRYDQIMLKFLCGLTNLTNSEKRFPNMANALKKRKQVIPMKYFSGKRKKRIIYKKKKIKKRLIKWLNKTIFFFIVRTSICTIQYKITGCLKIFCSPSTTLRSFGSPDHFGVFVLNAYKSFFFVKKWPVLQVKNLTLNKNLRLFFVLFSERRSRLSDTLQIQ